MRVGYKLYLNSHSVSLSWVARLGIRTTGIVVGFYISPQLGLSGYTKDEDPSGHNHVKDPLSPILFNLAVDVLSVMIKEAQQAGLIKGITPHLQENGYSNMQMTIFFFLKKVMRMPETWNLYCVDLFEQLSGLKIIFLKSEVFCLGGAREHGAIVNLVCYLWNIWEYLWIKPSFWISIGNS